MTDDKGEFRLENTTPELGQYSIEVSVPGLRAENVKLNFSGQPQTIRLKRGLTLTGRVVEAGTGNVIPNTEVRAWDSESYKQPAQKCRTDAEGRFEFTTLADVNYLFHVEDGSLSRNVSARPGQVTNLTLTIKLYEWSKVKPQPKVAPRETTPNGMKLIRPGELVVVTFSGVKAPPLPHEERVKTDGSILLPMIGNIQAAGKSADQLQQEIHTAYVPAFYQRLDITVKIETNAASTPQPLNLGATAAAANTSDFTDFNRETIAAKTSKTNVSSVAKNTFDRLNDIRLDNIYFQRLSLREVIRELEVKTKQADPEKLGVNFQIESSLVPIDPATGLPLSPTADELDSVLVTFRYRVSAPLKSILDQVVSCANSPIKYTFTNNIVRFSRRGPTESEPLFTRTFDLPPRTLYGKILTNLTQAEISRTASSNLAPMALQGFRTWLSGLGVNMDPKQGRSLFYSNGKGHLFARATLAELDIIEIAIVNLKHPAAALDSATFELEPTTIIRAIETQLPQFKPVTATNVTAGLRALLESAGADLSPPKTLYYNDRAGGLFVRATPQELDAIEDLLQVIGRQPPQVNVKAVFVELPLGKDQPKALAKLLEPVTPENGAAFTGILTAPQFKLILRTLETNSVVRILAAPQVTTLSGRQAQIQLADVKTIISGLTAVVTNGATNLVYQSQAMSFGPVLDILPTVANDGRSIQMTLTPTFTEFLGYEDAEQLKLSAPNDKAKLPLPVFRKRQINTAANVWDGQTIVMGNFSEEILTTLLPNEKNSSKSSPKKEVKQLLVFVTPTIIDQGGNPANAALEAPLTQPLR